jgi:hypothetical protein
MEKIKKKLIDIIHLSHYKENVSRKQTQSRQQTRPTTTQGEKT